MVDYIARDDIIIFSPNYNKPLEPSLLSKFNKIIFTDYILKDDLFERYENNKLYDLCRICSIFNQDVSNLPSELNRLIFGYRFDRDVFNLPSKLTHLTFGYHFNKDISNLPNSLEELELGCCFNLELDNLPNSIKKLVFHKYETSFNKELNCLPNSIEHLELPKEYNKKITIIPANLKKISCSKNYNWVGDYNNNQIQIELYD